jgi:nucleotide-binding universal stress UspA family protein
MVWTRTLRQPLTHAPKEARIMHEQTVTNTRHRILCGVDGSFTSEAAAQVAAQLARMLDLKLVLVHAAPDPPVFPYGDARASELQRRSAVRHASKLLDRTAAMIPHVEHETRVLLGPVVEGLAGLCDEDDVEMLVVGSRGRSGLPAAVLGSVSARLASTADCPVLVVPPGAVTTRSRLGQVRRGPIVCGVDASPESANALCAAIQIADRIGVELLPVHVDAVGSGTRIPRGVHERLQVDFGDAADGLDRRARRENAGLLVVGSRGRGALGAAVLGSVSRELIASASTPVLVVPRTARVTPSGGRVADDDAIGVAA